MADQDTLLGGCRVLDLTQDGRMLCGKLLGDLGADVIQIEPPGGSPARGCGPFYHDAPDPEKSLPWFFLGLNKRGITLDLDTEAGRDILCRLAASADFVIEGFEAGYIDGIGLGYRELEKLNPGIVFTSITPFGQTGPYAGYRTPDLVGVSLGGMTRLFGDLDGPPTRISAPQFHFLGGLHGALGSMMAHYHRELTGEGQYVDVSCQQAVALTLRATAETWDVLGVNTRGWGPYRVMPRPDMGDTIRVPLVFPCKDGYVAAMIGGGQQAGAVASSRALVALANRHGMALELKDYAWEAMDLATIPLEELEGIHRSIAGFLRSRTKAELLDAAVSHGILMIPVNTAEDVAASAQLASRDYWQRVAHPELGDTVTYPGWPVHWTGMPPYEPQRRSPLPGEHNGEVYRHELGLSEAEMRSLREQGAI